MEDSSRITIHDRGDHLRDEAADFVPESAVVLLAGESAAWQEPVRRALRRHCRVEVAQDAEAALRCMAHGLPDLIVAGDVSQPSEDRRVLDAAGRGRRPVPVLLVTHRPSAAVRLRAKHGGAFDFIVPPVDAEEVRARVTCLLARPAPGTREVTAAPAEAVHHVLVVEDDGIVRDMVQRLLEALGYTASSSSSAAQALEMLERQPDVDLVITDVFMPETNGTELAAEIRRRHPELPVMFMSGAPREDLLGRGLLDEGDAFLGKPFTAADLQRVVRGAVKP